MVTLRAGLPLFTSLCAVATIALVVASLVENKLVECSNGEWFGYTSMKGGEIVGSTKYTVLQKQDRSTDSIDSVAAFAWPAMALAISGALFSGLMVFFLFGRSESWRFTLVMGMLAVIVFSLSAVLSTLLVGRANDYIVSSTCMMGRDTYLVWAAAAVMIVGARLHAKSELEWGSGLSFSKI